MIALYELILKNNEIKILNKLLKMKFKLDPEDIKYLEELYVPHPVKGPMKKP